MASQPANLYPTVSPLRKSKNETLRKLDTHIERAFSTEVMEESDTDETPSPEPGINEKSQVSKPSAKTPTNLLAEIQEEMRISSQLRAHSTFVPEMHDHMAVSYTHLTLPTKA